MPAILRVTEADANKANPQIRYGALFYVTSRSQASDWSRKKFRPIARLTSRSDCRRMCEVP